MNIYHYLTFILTIGSFLLFSGCSSTPGQNKFEDEAMSTPENYTRTSNTGEVLNEDPDDWRISPRFSGNIEIFRPAYPNPSLAQTITIEYSVRSIGAVDGLFVYFRTNNGDFKIIRRFDGDRPTGLGQIRINPNELSQDFTLYHNNDLYRIFLYDSRENLITYGDIKISAQE